jgi:hypothetical protein
MSLSAWEQQALDSIKDGLAGSDPDLAALASAFNCLALAVDSGSHDRCTVVATMVCVHPAREHGSARAPRRAATRPQHEHRAVRTTQTGP